MNRILVASLLILCAGSATAAERPVIYAKSEIGFSVKQMGVKVSGTFKRFTAKDRSRCSKARLLVCANRSRHCEHQHR